MSRINVYEAPDIDDYYSGTTLVGWFESTKAERWSDADYNGDGSGGTGRGAAVWRTAKGRWVMESWTRWQNEENTYRFIEGGAARTWLLSNDFDDAVEKYLGEIDEEVGPGRPEIGKPVQVRLGDELTAQAEKVAEMDSIPRAEVIRRAVAEYTAKRLSHVIEGASR